MFYEGQPLVAVMSPVQQGSFRIRGARLALLLVLCAAAARAEEVDTPRVRHFVPSTSYAVRYDLSPPLRILTPLPPRLEGSE